MKKLLLLAIFGIAGVVSANEKTSRTIEKNDSIETFQSKSSNSKSTLLYRWIGVESPCGAVYFLNADDYSNWNEFIDDVTYFNAQKCGNDLGPLV